jgi:hypothetical protein
MKTFPTSRHYIACLHPKAGLILQSVRTNKGVVMRPDHPQFNEYVEAFEMIIDEHDADALCRALIC